jgi:acyl carrier protein
MSTDDISDRLSLCLPRLSELRPTTSVADLALDSMDTVELLCVIHAEFGVRLTEVEFHPQQTIGGLLTAIAQKATS